MSKIFKMKILATEKEKKILRQYMKNADDYLDKEITDEEYVNFQFDLDDLILTHLTKDYYSTTTSVLLQKIYDNIYYRETEEDLIRDEKENKE